MKEDSGKPCPDYRATFVAIEELMRHKPFKAWWDGLGNKRAWSIMERMAVALSAPTPPPPCQDHGYASYAGAGCTFCREASAKGTRR